MANTPKKFKWTVEFEVDATWVADGFDLTDARALDMLSNDLRFANIDTELGAKVITTPDQDAIAKVQGFKNAKDPRFLER